MYKAIKVCCCWHHIIGENETKLFQEEKKGTYTAWPTLARNPSRYPRGANQGVGPISSQWDIWPDETGSPIHGTRKGHVRKLWGRDEKHD